MRQAPSSPKIVNSTRADLEWVVVTTRQLQIRCQYIFHGKGCHFDDNPRKGGDVPAPGGLRADSPDLDQEIKSRALAMSRIFVSRLQRMIR